MYDEKKCVLLKPGNEMTTEEQMEEVRKLFTDKDGHYWTIKEKKEKRNKEKNDLYVCRPNRGKEKCFAFKNANDLVDVLVAPSKGQAQDFAYYNPQKFTSTIQKAVSDGIVKPASIWNGELDDMFLLPSHDTMEFIKQKWVKEPIAEYDTEFERVVLRPIIRNKNHFAEYLEIPKKYHGRRVIDDWAILNHTEANETLKKYGVIKESESVEDLY